ncbi:MAG: zinc ABC transporter substrate-binding protein [Gomphosphaeria aponina SAG 52.96 = DSM 107014]|uniref:Zinc ABC transporter substrate-binding protein n=1 Tax=Gomphosphaeria aponina SAG 52.96 = DSM 107014 TaxID=1521640 RepID=A0A941JM72_9CHRO|nr:zinc ABC transporter substrate-binding protein [Gomphosphaeria aponina SAG 52.96 = DSM 107014]
MLKSFFSKSLMGSALLMGLVGISSPSTADDRPLVVATTDILCDLTEQIAQETVNLQCLVNAGVDPHVYQPTPDDRRAIDAADLVLYAGYNFEPSLIKLVDATSNSAPKVAVNELAVPQPLMGSAHDHEAEETVPDPHVWHDPKNGIAMVNVIAQELENLQPDFAQKYQENANFINAEITQIESWIAGQIATIPPEKRKLVTTHDALGYYVNAYELEFEGALSGLSTDESPTAARVGELITEVKESNVPTIFAETSVNPKLIETVAREANVKVSERELYADGLGEKGADGDSYQKMLIANTQTIVEGLGGSFTEFQAE